MCTKFCLKNLYVNCKFSIWYINMVFPYSLFPTIFVVNVVDFLQLLCARCWHLEPAAHLVAKKTESTGTKEITMTRNNKKPVFWQGFQGSFDSLCSKDTRVFNRCSLNFEKMEACKNWAQNTRAATSDNRLKRQKKKERKKERKKGKAISSVMSNKCLLQAGRAHLCFLIWVCIGGGGWKDVRKTGRCQENVWWV